MNAPITTAAHGGVAGVEPDAGDPAVGFYRHLAPHGEDLQCGIPTADQLLRALGQKMQASFTDPSDDVATPMVSNIDSAAITVSPVLTIGSTSR